jgi:O-antigen ligase
VTTAVAFWLLFLGVSGATIFWSINVDDTVVGFLPFVGIVALYIAIRLSPVDRVVLTRTESAILAGASAAAAYGIVQFATSSLPRSQGGGGRFGRDLLDPNHTATALTLALAIAVYKMANPGRRLDRPMGFGVAVLLLVAIMLTGSRGGVLCALVVLVVSAALGHHRFVTLLSAGLVAAALTVVILLAPAVVPDRLASTDSTGRIDIWKVGVAACMTHCAYGTGWGTFGLVYADTLPSVTNAAVTPSGVFFEPHNIWILAAVETGILGLLLMTTGLGLVVREAVRIPRAQRGPPMSALVGLLFSGLLLSNLEFKYFWMVLIYVALVYRVHRAERVPFAEIGGARDEHPAMSHQPAMGDR